MWAIDKHQGGASHDLLRPEVRESIRHACLSVEAGGSGAVCAAHIASPCRSFSPLRVESPLRLRDDPMGETAPAAFQAYLRNENTILTFCAVIFNTLVDRSCYVTWENPPDISVPDTPWYWPERAHLASLWHTPSIARIRARVPTIFVTAAMCRFGSEYRKYFTLIAPAYMQHALSSFEDMWCPGGEGHRHHTPAIGTAADGEAHAAKSGRYPRALNAALLDALTQLPAASSAHAIQPGSIRHGPGLSPELNAAVQAARIQPVGFASLRNLAHAPEEQLWRTPLPDVRRMAAALVPPDAPRRHVGWDGSGHWRSLVPGAPPGPITLSCIVGQDHLARWEAYLAATQRAFDAIRANKPHRSPGEFVLREDDLPPWAQGVVWDCEDPVDCKPVRRSTAHTPVAGPRQLNRARLRYIAAQLGWDEVDADIVQQLGHGGAELRSAAPLHTTAKWHHPGVCQNFSVADDVVREERREQWTRVSSSCLPFVPCVFSPRDVIFQERSKLIDGVLQLMMKPRVTHNMSAVPRALGGRTEGMSINSGVDRTEKTLTGLPNVQGYARAQAVCALAGGSQDPAAAHVYGIDETKAYCFLPAQKADHYASCYLWVDADGVVRAHVSERLVFGGSPWPNRYERVALLQCAWIQHIQRQFDESHPLPMQAREWVRKRRELQARGLLPSGEAQCWPAGIEPFIDDLSGRALADPVPVPAHLRDIPLGAEQTRAIGALPSPEESRVAVHCRIAAAEVALLGMECASDKTMCGSGMLILGAQLDATARRVRCPAVKREWLLHATRKMRASVSASASVELRLLERFVGRLTHMSQFFPEVRPALAVGYALCNVRYRSPDDPRASRRSQASLRRGGQRETELYTLMDIADAIAQDAVGVSMAPADTFADGRSPGVVTLVTDASRATADDGFGGFAFVFDKPGEVFIMSEEWPPHLKAALDRAAARRDERRRHGPHLPVLSMPAAETFAVLALAAAVAAVTSVSAAISISDCAPATSALSSLYSPTAQIRRLLAACRQAVDSWLGVHVPREWNTDADRLSHPSMLPSVIADAEQSGLSVVRVHTPSWVWDTATQVLELPVGSATDAD